LSPKRRNFLRTVQRNYFKKHNIGPWTTYVVSWKCWSSSGPCHFAPVSKKMTRHGWEQSCRSSVFRKEESQTGWPDEFVKKRPKCSPEHWLSKCMHHFYHGEK
jgi:hypothetical protein